MRFSKILPLVWIISVWGQVAPVFALQQQDNQGNSDGWWSVFSASVMRTWQTNQHYDLYLPAITWHARFAYDKVKTDKYNEHPWGAGFGLSRYDDKKNWHGLYLMMFKDSFNKWEPIMGYGWEARWQLSDNDFSAGLGYTAGITARDNWRYIPLPLILPLASVNYGPVSFQMTYIPGSYNNGNVYFAWLRLQF